MASIMEALQAQQIAEEGKRAPMQFEMEQREALQQRAMRDQAMQQITRQQQLDDTQRGYDTEGTNALGQYFRGMIPQEPTLGPSTLGGPNVSVVPTAKRPTAIPPMTLPTAIGSILKNNRGISNEGLMSAIKGLGPMVEKPGKGFEANTLAEIEYQRALQDTGDHNTAMERAKAILRAQAPELQAGAEAKAKGTPIPEAAMEYSLEAEQLVSQLGGVNADLQAIIQGIGGGDLTLGPVENAASMAKNWLGMSDPNSQNFATLKSILEQQRNASLLLAKGVQTEGDAIRAWNQLMANLNDGANVKQRLIEIDALNKRNAELAMKKSNAMRENYGRKPGVFDEAFQRPAAVTMEKAAPTAPASTTAPQEGQTAINKKTGQVLTFRGGQWQ